MSRSKNWIFTDFELLNFENIFKNDDNIRGLAWGLEQCPSTLKEHNQGYVQFNSVKRLTEVKKKFGTKCINVRIMKGTFKQNLLYCSKDNKFKTLGKFMTQGKSGDIMGIWESLKEGISNYDLIEDDPLVFATNIRFIKEARRAIKEQNTKEYLEEWVKNIVLNERQKKWHEVITNQNDRKVSWVYDLKGGSGKTIYSKYLLAQGNAIRFTNSRSKDIAYAYNGEKYVIFDFSRSLENHVNYDIIEQIKNGMLFSSKYESSSKIFEPPKILIMSNFYPDISKLSEDRWDIKVVVEV